MLEAATCFEILTQSRRSTRRVGRPVQGRPRNLRLQGRLSIPSRLPVPRLARYPLARAHIARPCRPASYLGGVVSLPSPISSLTRRRSSLARTYAAASRSYLIHTAAPTERANGSSALSGSSSNMSVGECEGSVPLEEVERGEMLLWLMCETGRRRLVMDEARVMVGEGAAEEAGVEGFWTRGCSGFARRGDWAK